MIPAIPLLVLGSALTFAQEPASGNRALQNALKGMHLFAARNPRVVLVQPTVRCAIPLRVVRPDPNLDPKIVLPMAPEATAGGMPKLEVMPVCPE